MDIIVCAKQVLDVAEIKIHPESKEPLVQGIPKKISDIIGYIVNFKKIGNVSTINATILAFENINREVLGSISFKIASGVTQTFTLTKPLIENNDVFIKLFNGGFPGYLTMFIPNTRLTTNYTYLFENREIIFNFIDTNTVRINAVHDVNVEIDQRYIKDI